MATVKIYGIKNCDAMKKAFTWLDEHGIAYDFFDYKKTGADADVLKAAIAQHGWNTVINRKGTSWRALPDDVKANMTEQSAIQAAMENPSLIKRPLLVRGKTIQLGFNADDYAGIFK